MKDTKDPLIEKYNVPAPRYTSYPTVPFWETKQMSTSEWSRSVNRIFKESNSREGISLYIHLPYCESLCTYCACNTRITKNHKVEKDYIDALLQEWHLYLALLDHKPTIREIHIGGGTPTFFSPVRLNTLIEGLLKEADLHPRYNFSFEGHPNNTSLEHLRTLYNLGFKRVSFGIQDFDLKVQQTINRVQPYKNVARVTDQARAIGYDSINFDLIYGLPFQTEATIDDTFQKTLQLRPDRIAFYSYAHVPWKHRGQRAYSSIDLPDKSAKRALYDIGENVLRNEGYLDIGMDHFALKGDTLFNAYRNKTLHRNFMGYTTSPTSLLIGLGASAISDAKYAYTQNCKNITQYKAAVTSGKLAITAGHQLSNDDQLIREIIKDILCKGEVKWRGEPAFMNIDTMIGLHTMADEGLVNVFENGFRVTDMGAPFVRNICMLFDQYLNSEQLENDNKFSKAI